VTPLIPSADTGGAEWERRLLTSALRRVSSSSYCDRLLTAWASMSATAARMLRNSCVCCCTVIILHPTAQPKFFYWAISHARFVSRSSFAALSR